jgi:hypothetical protein
MAHLADAVTTRRWLKEHWLYLALLVVSIFVVMVTGAKFGAGSWHCMPVVIPALWAGACLWSIAEAHLTADTILSRKISAPLWGVALALIWMLGAATKYGILLRIQHYRLSGSVDMRSVERDLLNISRNHPTERIHVGTSDDAHQYLTTVKSILYIRGANLFVDEYVRSDNHHARVPLTGAVIDGLNQCAVSLWIIPRGGEPFSMGSSIDWTLASAPDGEIYPTAFREAFLHNYVKLPVESPYFDLWKCEKTQK